MFRYFWNPVRRVHVCTRATPVAAARPDPGPPPWQSLITNPVCLCLCLSSHCLSTRTHTDRLSSQLPLNCGAVGPSWRVSPSKSVGESAPVDACYPSTPGWAPAGSATTTSHAASKGRYESSRRSALYTARAHAQPPPPPLWSRSMHYSVPAGRLPSVPAVRPPPGAGRPLSFRLLWLVLLCCCCCLCCCRCTAVVVRLAPVGEPAPVGESAPVDA
jgi:hypothetical protein